MEKGAGKGVGIRRDMSFQGIPSYNRHRKFTIHSQKASQIN